MRWDTVRTSLLFAWRATRRGPGFATVVIVTLGLGIGANLAMFGVVDRLLLSPPAGIDRPDELHRIWVRRPPIGWSGGFGAGGIEESRSFTWSGYRDLVGLSALDGVAAYAGSVHLTLGQGPDAQRVRVQQVSGSYFSLLGTGPFLGRVIQPRDDSEEATPIAVVSHAFWTRALGSNPDVIGRQLHIGAGRYEVVGVAPPGFTGVNLTPVDVWLPMTPSGVAESGDGWITNRQWWWLYAVARLRDPQRQRAANDEMTAAHRGGYGDVEGYDADRAEVFAAPLIAARGPDPSRESRVALWLAGVSLLVLLVTYANVANLFLARGERWRRELALRMALGVPRRRLLVELLTESLLLTLAGAGAALAVVRWGGRPLQALLLPNVAYDATVTGGRMLAFTGAVSVLTVVLAGLLPAYRASRVDVRGALHDEVRGRRTGSRTRTALVIFQAALSAVLLIGAGVFLRSLSRARGVDLGFDADRVAVVHLERTEEPAEDAADLYRMAEEALPRLPEVVSAARVTAVPFQSAFALPVFALGVDSMLTDPESGPARMDAVGAGYFETMGIDLLEGRGIEASDLGEGVEPVAVVSLEMAERVWADGALGECVKVGGEDEPCSRIVGVAENITQTRLREPPTMVVWVPQGSDRMRGVGALAVRLASPPGEAIPTIRRELASLSPSVRFARVEMLSDPVARQVRSWRLGASVLTALGVLAWLVAGMGLYSLLAFEVAQKRREMGIRKALGARYSSLFSRMILQGVRLTVAGVAIGATLAWATASLVAPLLFEVSPRTPGVYASAAVALLAVAFAASVPVAHRAARADPTDTMRAE